MEVYWYADRNGINNFYIKVTERSIDDRNGINNFYIKVTERSSIDLPMTLGLFIEIEPSKLGYSGLLVR